MDSYILIYSAEISVCKVARTPTPPGLHEGMMLLFEGGLIQIEKLVWFAERGEMVALAGYHCYHNGEGDLAGARLYFPFGHMPGDLVEKLPKPWKDLPEITSLYRMILAPVRKVGSVGHAKDVYIVE